jgi:hypothetical protein
MEAKKYLLSFKGNKQEIHKQLKELCEKEGQSMNATILDLIQKHIQKNEKNRLNKNG